MNTQTEFDEEDNAGHLDEWFYEKAALGPVFLVNAKGFTPQSAVKTMLETGHWDEKQLNSKLGRMVERIVELAADGEYLTNIAIELGIDKSGLRRFTDKLGIEVTSPPEIDDMTDMVLELLEEGASAPKIAEELGFDVSSVRAWLKKNNLDVRDPYHGGFTIAKGKYICIPSPKHPAADSKGYVRLHRLMAERAVGRYLKPDEDVHHIDGNSFNNHPDNLQVLTREEHTRIHAKNGDCGWSAYHSKKI